MSSKAISELLKNLKEQTADQERVEVNDFLELSSGRALGPLLLIPGLLMVSPLAGVPSAPTILAIFVVIISVQLLLGIEKLWLPRRLKTLGVDQERFEKTIKALKPKAKVVERFFKPRLETMVSKPAKRLAGGLAIAIACTVPPLEFLPMAALAPGIVILLLGISITTHDGLAMLISLLTLLGSLGGGVWLYLN